MWLRGIRCLFGVRDGVGTLHRRGGHRDRGNIDIEGAERLCGNVRVWVWRDRGAMNSLRAAGAR